MTDEAIKELAYEPIVEAWRVIHMTQNLTQNDTDKWEEYIKAHDDFCKKYDYGVKGSYGYYLGMAIMAIVDDIARENKGENAS